MRSEWSLPTTADEQRARSKRAERLAARTKLAERKRAEQPTAPKGLKRILGRPMTLIELQLEAEFRARERRNAELWSDLDARVAQQMASEERYS
jgi:hypothetical protein